VHLASAFAAVDFKLSPLAFRPLASFVVLISLFVCVVVICDSYTSHSSTAYLPTSPRIQYGVTALHQAVRGDHATCVALLLRYGADVFAKNVQGQSALEEAIDDELSAAETVTHTTTTTTTTTSTLLGPCRERVV